MHATFHHDISTSKAGAPGSAAEDNDTDQDANICVLPSQYTPLLSLHYRFAMHVQSMLAPHRLTTRPPSALSLLKHSPPC